MDEACGQERHLHSPLYSTSSNSAHTLFNFDKEEHDLENYILLPVDGSGFVVIKQSIGLCERDLEG